MLEWERKRKQQQTIMASITNLESGGYGRLLDAG